MDRKNFEQQVTGFTQDDPTIMDKAMETIADFYANPTRFGESIANTPTPEHLWNLALSAQQYHEPDMLITIRTVALTAKNIFELTRHLIEDPVLAEQMRDNVQNYNHVINLIDSM
jgi:hypothetical protein